MSTLNTGPYISGPQFTPADEQATPSYGDAWGAALTTLGDFIGGFGSANRVYGPSSIDVRSFLASKGAAQMNSNIRYGIISGELNGSGHVATAQAAMNVPFDLFHSPVGPSEKVCCAIARRFSYRSFRDSFFTLGVKRSLDRFPQPGTRE